MKKKEPEIIYNVHEDAELETLAKAFVQAASNRNMTMTQASSVIAQIWREDITAPEVEKKMIRMSLDETDEQLAFREKVVEFIDTYPEFIRFYNNPMLSKSWPGSKQFTIELICAIYKMFTEEDTVQASTLNNYIRDYFKQRFHDDPNYSNPTTIWTFKEHIFETIDHLRFKTTRYADIGSYRYVDKTFVPTITDKPFLCGAELEPISYIADPYLQEREYVKRRAKTTTKIIQLIWIIETFF